MKDKNTRAPCALMSRTEAAKYLRVSPRTLSRRMEEGVLPFVRTSERGRIYFQKSQLDIFIKKNTYSRKRCG